MHQLQDGCSNAECTTPACYSHMAHHSQGPIRKYTPLSAKSIALCLINRPDPLAQLCPNVANRTGLQINRPIPGHDHLLKSSNFSLESSDMPRDQSANAIPCKDPKSFSQNLLDTVKLEQLNENGHHTSQIPLDSLSNLNTQILRSLFRLRNHKVYEYPQSQSQIDANRKHEEGIQDYINQSLFYTFGHVDSVLRFAVEIFPVTRVWPEKSDLDNTLDFYLIYSQFVVQYTKTILDCLWDALRALFNRPRALSKQKPDSRYVKDEEAASLLALCVVTLVAAIDVRELDDHGPDENESLRYPNFLPCYDETATWHAERLARRLAQVVHARHCFHLAKSKMSNQGIKPSVLDMFIIPTVPIFLSIQHFREQTEGQNFQIHTTPARLFLRWEKLLFVQAWDGSSILHRGSVAGCHLGLLRELCMLPSRVSLLHINLPLCRLWPPNVLPSHGPLPDFFGFGWSESISGTMRMAFQPDRS